MYKRQLAGTFWPPVKVEDSPYMIVSVPAFYIFEGGINFY